MLFLYWIWIILLPFRINPEPKPIFKNGEAALQEFIRQSIVYPDFSKRNCIQGTITISFKLDHSGNIFESKVQKGFGIDLDDEALRVTKLTSGKWIVPAGYDTTTAVILPINFALQNYNCERLSREEINQSINAYRSEQNLNEAIVNFYQNKEKGNYKPNEEQTINQLKAELGYDDEFIAQKLKQAQTKLKQGDKENACKDLTFIHNLGSDKADKLIEQNCH